MKPRFLLLMLLLLCSLPALAEDTAPELTRSASLTYAPRSKGKGTLLDSDYLTYFSGAYLEVQTVSPCHHLYFSYALDETDVAIQVQGESGAWTELLTDDRHYTNSYLALPGLTRFRIVPRSSETLSLSELHHFGEGELPGWVQTWQSGTGLTLGTVTPGRTVRLRPPAAMPAKGISASTAASSTHRMVFFIWQSLHGGRI